MFFLWPAPFRYVFANSQPVKKLISPLYSTCYLQCNQFSAVHGYLWPPFPHMYLPMASLSTAWRMRDMDWMVLAYTAPSSSFTFHFRKCHFTLLLGSNNMIDAAGETWLISGIQICQLFFRYIRVRNITYARKTCSLHHSENRSLNQSENWNTNQSYGWNLHPRVGLGLTPKWEQ